MIYPGKLAPLLLATLALSAACGDSGNTAPSGSGAAGSAAPDAEKPTHTLSTSATHTCALRNAGIFCWGANDKGQLGTQNTSDSATPVAAKVDAKDVAELRVHSGRSCIRRRSGRVSCGGANESGQLGDGTRSDALAPVDAAISDARQLALSDTSTCALRADASVSCWGGSADDAALTPATIEGLSEVVEVQSGPMSAYCARGKAGWTRCWRLDNGSWSAASDVAALSGATALALASAQEVCAVVDGQVVCSDLAGAASSMSVSLRGSSGVVALVSGLLTVCGGDSAGTWGCWNILSPAVLQTIGAMKRELGGPWKELTTAGYRYCALGADDRVACMESNVSQQLAVVADLPE
jgi:hypothetical protein